MQALTPLCGRALLAPCLIALASAAAAQSQPGIWDGTYWGLSLAVAGQGDDRVAVAPPGIEAGALSLHGGLAAVQVGWRSHSGAIVWGAEGDLQFGRVADSFTAAPYSAQSRISQAASLRLLAGLPAGASGLIYLTGGVAMANFDYAVSSTAGLAIVDSGFRSGYALGAGYEVALTSGWSARFEYQYTSYGKITLADGLVTTEATPDYHALRLGMNHRF